jgi:hypothetical protein
MSGARPWRVWSAGRYASESFGRFISDAVVVGTFKTKESAEAKARDLVDRGDRGVSVTHRDDDERPRGYTAHGVARALGLRSREAAS